MLNSLIRSDKRVYVFVGGTGSGKSELAVNLAFDLAAAGRAVHFFDLDQTKPVFRSRAVADRMAAAGIGIARNKEMLDARTLPDGVGDHVRRAAETVVLDVGGDGEGAVVLGQFARDWGADAVAYLAINPYRAFAETAEDMAGTVAAISRTSRLAAVEIVANPNFGAGTEIHDVLDGHARVQALLMALRQRPAFAGLAVLRPLAAAVAGWLPSVPLIPLTRFIRAPWELDEPDFKESVNAAVY